MGATLGPEAINQIRMMFRDYYFRNPIILPREENIGRTTVPVKIGKADAAINSGTFASPNSGTVSVWTGDRNFVSLADSGDNITAFNFWGNIASGKQVACLPTPMGWLIIAAQC